MRVTLKVPGLSPGPTLKVGNQPKVGYRMSLYS